MEPRPHHTDVVRPLSRAASRTCARPGCPSPASATLTFRYADRAALLVDLTAEREPSSYDLCAGHAERTGPPHGWTLDDQRHADDGADGPIGEERTVALLAEMLGRDRTGRTDRADRTDRARQADQADPAALGDRGDQAAPGDRADTPAERDGGGRASAW